MGKNAMYQPMEIAGHSDREFLRNGYVGRQLGKDWKLPAAA